MGASAYALGSMAVVRFPSCPVVHSDQLSGIYRDRL